MRNIINLVNKYTKYKCDQILTCDRIYFGYTNNSYLVELKDQTKIFVKYAISKTINKIDEGRIYKLYSPENLIYSNNNGLLITHGIYSYQDISKHNLFDLLIGEINRFHQMKIDNDLQTFNYYEYDNLLDKFSIENETYHSLVKKGCVGDMVVSHNDINDKNYIVTKEHGVHKVILIDFEGTTNNFAGGDYINYLAEQKIYDKSIGLKGIEYIPDANSIDDIYEMLFIRGGYCYGGSMHEKNVLPNMKEYIDKCEFNIDIIKTKLN